MQDIADRCQVHQVTVSRALRGESPYVSAALRERILATAREMGYDPAMSHAARRLRISKTDAHVISHVIAIFFPEEFYTYAYFQTIYNGILEYLMARQFALVTYFANPSRYPLSPIFTRGDVDGIICSHYRAPEIFDLLQHLRALPQFGDRPVLSLLDPAPGVSAILTDDEAGGYAAAAHLLDLGHRHLLHFIDPGDEYSQRQRLVGYRRAFRERGLDADAFLHFGYVGLYTPPYLHGYVLDALRSYPQTTGILARNDYTARYLRDELASLGIKVPSAMSLVGYDDTDPLCDHDGKPFLTTIQAPLREIGHAAAAMIIGQVTGQENSDAVRTLPVQPILRRSTSHPRNDTLHLLCEV